MSTLTKAALAATLIILAGIVGHFDAEDADAQHDLYCSMTATWKAEATQGVPINNRTGWPPYDGECIK
jgi:hypothetical protein